MPQSSSYRKAKENPFIRAAGSKHYGSDRQKQRVPKACCPYEPRECPKHEGSAQSRNRTATRVGIDPITKETQPQNREYAAEQRPGWRQPGLQHPAERCAHQCRHAQNTNPWVPYECLARGQNK